MSFRGLSPPNLLLKTVSLRNLCIRQSGISKLSHFDFQRIWPKKPIFWGMVLVHVNNFWLVLGMAFKIYSGSKGLKLHVKNLGGLIPTFGEVTGEKLALQPFCLPPSWTGLKINHLIPMMVSRHSVSPPPHLFIEGLGVLKNHSRGSRCSCKNEKMGE